MAQKKLSLPGRFLIFVVVGYLGVLIIAPITALVNGAIQNGFFSFVAAFFAPELMESLSLSLKIALAVVAIQLVMGTITAWVIVRHDFRGKWLVNGLLDTPFCLSPVVAGYMLLLLFGREGMLNPILDQYDIQIAFAVPGMFLATLFVSLPFMTREMIPVISCLDKDQEYAAATLGASKWTIFWKVIFPSLRGALIYGMTLTLARSLGEFGAVLVIGGGVQGRTETATLYIYRCLEERMYVEAYAASIFLGVFSILMVSIADWWHNKSLKTP